MGKEKIKVFLKKKMQEISDSILQYELKEIFNNHTFIAGGAVRSLLEGTNINDYDIYFKSKQKAKEFEDLYYKGISNNLHHNELSKIINKNMTIIKPFTNMNKLVMKFPKKYTHNALLNGKEKIQFVIKISGTPKEIIDKFDFTNSMGYYDFSNDNLFISNKMQESITKKELIFNEKCLNPLMSLNRFTKFMNRGYNCNTSELKKLMVLFRNANDKDYEEYNLTSFY